METSEKKPIRPEAVLGIIALGCAALLLIVF